MAAAVEALIKTPTSSALVDWLVVGGGPCGTCAVGALLQRGGSSVGWVSRSSWESMGRLGTYGEVPANTRNDRLLGAFRSLEAFEFEKRQRLRGPSGLAAAEPGGTGELRMSVDALVDASLAMRESGRLAVSRDEVFIHSLVKAGEHWEAHAGLGEVVCRFRRAVLATGGAPRQPSEDLSKRLREAGISTVDLDDALAPFARGRGGERHGLAPVDCLKGAVRGRRVAILGGAHSGMLAAKNCVDRGATVTVYDLEGEPKFACERDGYIKYDGTGLKGEVAAWARAAVGAVVAFERLDAADEGAVLERLRAAETDVLVYAVGFEPTAPPDVFADEARVDLPAKAARDGALVDGAIYGAGLAYPEVWTDPEGHSEPRVGFVTHYLRHLGTIFANAGPPPGPREAKRRRRASRGD